VGVNNFFHSSSLRVILSGIFFSLGAVFLVFADTPGFPGTTGVTAGLVAWVSDVDPDDAGGAE
jgi:hypothetical protein